MQYLLFVNFNTGLMHNCVHKKLEHVLESVEQLIADEEGLDLEEEKMPNISEVKESFERHDDFCQELSNGTWFHIQPRNVFEVVK